MRKVLVFECFLLCSGAVCYDIRACSGISSVIVRVPDIVTSVAKSFRN